LRLTCTSPVSAPGWMLQTAGPRPRADPWLGSNDALSASIVTVRSRTANRLKIGAASRYTPYVFSLA